mgnify:CR=1 FL=1
MYDIQIFFKEPDDDEFPYYSAHELLRGSCNHFAVALQRVLRKNDLIIVVFYGNLTDVRKRRRG